METNRQIADYMFNKMREYGFKPYDIDVDDGYFVFNYGDESVYHFRLKGVWKHWKFGMWVFSNYLDEEYRKKYYEEHPEDKQDPSEWKVIQIFCQYDHIIDKFKPSASSLCVEYDYEQWENKDNWKRSFWELEDMLKTIKRHPLLCYTGALGRGMGYAPDSAMKEFFHDEWYYYKKNIKKNFYISILLPYTKVKIFFAKRDKIVKDIELHNFEKENSGWSTSYLYSVEPVFANGTTDEEMQVWRNKWFKKDKYGEYAAYDYVIEIDESHYWIESDEDEVVEE